MSWRKTERALHKRVARRLYQRGWTLHQIADVYGTCHGHVVQWLTAYCFKFHNDRSVSRLTTRMGLRGPC